MATDPSATAVAADVKHIVAPVVAQVQQPTVVSAPPAAAAAAAVPKAAPPAPQQQQQQRQQMQPRPQQPEIHVQQSRVSPLDAVIDEVLAGDLGLPERQLAADEVAYSYFSSIRDEIGDDMDPETSAKLNELAATSLREQDAIMQKTNRVARKILRPLGYKMLEVQGLDPATVDPAAARAALEQDLTSEQQAVVDAEAERLFKEVYLPELRAAARDADVPDPDDAWEQFGRDIMARRPEEPQQQSTAAVAVPAALAGAVVALVVSKLFGWLQRRRHGKQEHSGTGSEYYEEEIFTGSDSGQDAASAYDE